MLYHFASFGEAVIMDVSRARRAMDGMSGRAVCQIAGSRVDGPRGGESRGWMPMRRALVAAVLTFTASWAMADAREAVLETFRAQLELERRLLVADASGLERFQEQLRGATDRLVRLGDDLIRAQREGEDAGSLNARSLDLRRAEVEVGDLIAQSQQVRATMSARRDLVEQLAAEVKRLEEGAGAGQDELSGRWLVSIEPGGQKGVFELRLEGTIATGVYQLDGGWKGSLRGTLIGGNLKLERIDAQLGFVATYGGRVVTRGSEKRLEGTWEATNLAAGLPISGTWVARREQKSP